MRCFRIPLPRQHQSASIMRGTDTVLFEPFLDGDIGFDFIVVRSLNNPNRQSNLKELVALVRFDRDLELDESVLLRLKYDAEPTEFSLKRMKRFNIAETDGSHLEKDDDHAS